MRGTVDFGLTEAEPGHSPMRYWEVFDDRLRLYASEELMRRLGSEPSWAALESIAPILWECDGDLEPLVLKAFEINRLREHRIRHGNLRLRSLSAVYSAVATGRHAGYVTERLVEGHANGNPRMSTIPAFDIPIRYWFFGPHQGLGEMLSSAIKKRGPETTAICCSRGTWQRKLRIAVGPVARHQIHHFQRFADLDIERVYLTGMHDIAFPDKGWKAEQRLLYYRKVAKERAQRVRKRGARLDAFLDAVAESLLLGCPFLADRG